MAGLSRQVGKMLFTSKLPNIQAQIEAEMLRRVRQAAIVVRNEWLGLLVGPRTGRYYRIPGTHRARRSGMARFRRGQAPKGGWQVGGESETGAASLLSTGTGLKGRQGFYRASSPGEAPAQRLARLRQSIRFYAVRISTGVRGRIGSHLRYAAWLEKGTQKMAPRPSLAPALDRSRREVESILTRPLELR